MKIDFFIKKTNLLRDLDYIKSNIKCISKKKHEKKLNELKLILNQKINNNVSQKICKNLVLSKLSNDNLDLSSKSIFVRVSGEFPKMDYFLYGRDSSKYYVIDEEERKSLIVQFKDQKSAEHIFSQLSNFDNGSTRLELFRSIEFSSLDPFEKILIGNPSEQEILQRYCGGKGGGTYIKKTPIGLIVLRVNYDEAAYYGAISGDFESPTGLFFSWYVQWGGKDQVLNIRGSIHQKQISSSDLNLFYSMLEDNVRRNPSELKPWRKLYLNKPK
jgi:hypothetical protein